MTPLLTLVIPTCNRPDYISVPVQLFLENPSPEISVIICDASDSSGPTKAALEKFANDPRFVYIDNTVALRKRPVSMLENWNTALDHVTGKWVSVIGDDDVLDNELLNLLHKIEAQDSIVESVRWQSAKAVVLSEWLGKEVRTNVKIPMGTTNHLADNSDHLDKILKWETFPRVPQKLSGLYHGAVKMDVLRKLKQKRGDWFLYCNLDFEIGWFISLETKLTFFSERPFSINGVSPSSNSWGVRDPEIAKLNRGKSIKQGNVTDGWTDHFMQSHQDTGGDEHFFSMLPVTVWGTMIKFCQEINREITLETKMNFAKILIMQSKTMQSQASFDWYITNTKLFLSLFFEKKEVQFQVPTFSEPDTRTVHSGLVAGELHIRRNLIPGNYENLARLILSLLQKVQK